MWNSFTPWYFIFTEETFNRITWRVVSFRHEPVSMWLCVASISSASPQICGPEIFLFECWSLSSQNYKKNYITASEIITARKRSCGKVLFSHLCVILLTGGGLCPWGRGSLSRGGLCQGDPHTVQSGQYASYWNAFLLWYYSGLNYDHFIAKSHLPNWEIFQDWKSKISLPALCHPNLRIWMCLDNEDGTGQQTHALCVHSSHPGNHWNRNARTDCLSFWVLDKLTNVTQG